MDKSYEKTDINEIVEVLDQLELTIIEYEELFKNGVEKTDLVHIIFRHAHNLKSALFVINKSFSSKLIHCVESNFDLIRKGKALVSDEMLKVCLKSIDLIRSNLSVENENESGFETLINDLENIYDKQLNSKPIVHNVKVPLNKNEKSFHQKAIDGNLNLYMVEKLINSDISKDDYDNLFIYQDIKELGFHITTFPKYNEIEREQPQSTLKIVFATKFPEADLGMYIFDPVKQINLEPVISEEKIILKEEKHDKTKILVVEQDFFSRRLLQNILSEFGVCDVASGTEEALIAFSHVLENEKPYDLVTIDILMDKKGEGHPVLKMFREIEKSQGIGIKDRTKILVATSLDDTEDIITSFMEEADAYLFKPITKSKVFNQISKIDLLKRGLIKYETEYPEFDDNDLVRDIFEKTFELIQKVDNDLKILSENKVDAGAFSEIHKNLQIVKNMMSFINMEKIEKLVKFLCKLLNYSNKPEDITSETIIQLTGTVTSLLNGVKEQVINELSEKIIENDFEQITELFRDILPNEIYEQIISTHEEPPEITSESDLETEQAEELMENYSSEKFLSKYLSDAMDILYLLEIKMMELELNQTSMELVSEILGYIHNLKGNSGFLGITEMEDLCMEMEDILGNVLEQKQAVNNELISKILIKIDNGKNVVNEYSSKGKEEETSKSLQSSTDEELMERKSQSVQRKNVRVDTDKLDKLFDLVGELITVESILVNDPEMPKTQYGSLRKNMSMLNKITRELQEITMSVRMIPLENLFNRMKRLVRDLSLKTGKKVNFNISGQDTEMDKNIIEELADPLVHILRNAIDHGIESELERQEKHKSAEGKVELSAGYEGNEIIITIKDDGKGLDREKIINKAKERGLLTDNAEYLSDQKVFSFIFEPGFSTSENISEISGRGVGMDVVRKNIEKLRGKVDVDSVRGHGSKFTMRIPLTMAIIDGMLVRVGDTCYAIPLLTIMESLRPARDSITVTMDGQEIVRVRNELYPVIRLHEIFNKESDIKELDKGILTIVESNNKIACIFADEILGQQQMVIKGLDSYIGDVRGIMGCMILGNGEIGLIIDVDKVIEMSEI